MLPTWTSSCSPSLGLSPCVPLCISPTFPLILLLWALQEHPSGVPLKTYLLCGSVHPVFFAGYDWSFFNNSPSMSLQPTVSSAHNHPSAFCPLRAGKLETCNSSHFEWEVSLAFQTTVCTKWQFSGDLGGALPAKEWIRPLTDNAVGPSSLSTWVLASSLKSGGRVKPTVPRPFPTRCSFQRSFASLKEQSFPVVSLVVRGPAWSKALHVQLFSQLWLSKPLSSL